MALSAYIHISCRLHKMSIRRHAKTSSRNLVFRDWDSNEASEPLTNRTDVSEGVSLTHFLLQVLPSHFLSPCFSFHPRLAFSFLVFTFSLASVPRCPLFLSRILSLHHSLFSSIFSLSSTLKLAIEPCCKSYQSS